MDAAPSSTDDGASDLPDSFLMRLTKNELCHIIYDMHCALIDMNKELIKLRREFELERSRIGDSVEKDTLEEYPILVYDGSDYLKKPITSEIAAYLIAVNPRFVARVEHCIDLILSRREEQDVFLLCPLPVSTAALINFMFSNSFTLSEVYKVLDPDECTRHRPVLDMLIMRVHDRHYDDETLRCLC